MSISVSAVATEIAELQEKFGKAPQSVDLFTVSSCKMFLSCMLLARF